MGHPRNASDALPGEGHVERWTPARKEELLRRIRAGEITRGEALSRWKISVEELDAWMVAARRAGRAGLKASAVAPVQERLL